MPIYAERCCCCVAGPRPRADRKMGRLFASHCMPWFGGGESLTQRTRASCTPPRPFSSDLSSQISDLSHAAHAPPSCAPSPLASSDLGEFFSLVDFCIPGTHAAPAPTRHSTTSAATLWH
eukprot:3595340-Prymnesium_polylepis.1